MSPRGSSPHIAARIAGSVAERRDGPGERECLLGECVFSVPRRKLSVGGIQPGWSPLRSLNLSGLCATTKLLQCRASADCREARSDAQGMMGIEMVSVERKLQMTSAPDIGADDLRYRRMANEVIKAHSKAHPGIRNQWTPILYAYELYRPEVKEMSRMGHMYAEMRRRWAETCRVWTDPTLTRFLLVFCWPNPSCGHMSVSCCRRGPLICRRRLCQGTDVARPTLPQPRDLPPRERDRAQSRMVPLQFA